MYKITVQNLENGEVEELECRGYLFCGVSDVDGEDADYDLSLQNIDMIDLGNIDGMIDEALDEIFPPHNTSCHCENNCECNCDNECHLGN
jgi:hypothetical protein